jgi:hypothetical protein
MMRARKFLFAIAVILELLSVGLFLAGDQTAIAASLLVIGLTALIVAINTGGTLRRS